MNGLKNNKKAPSAGTLKAERKIHSMTIISDLKRKINLYFFDSEDVDGDAYLFYGVIGLMLVMAIIYTTLNII